jgi:CubicO group peptidase (beta-lactamase class C family)
MVVRRLVCLVAGLWLSATLSGSSVVVRAMDDGIAARVDAVFAQFTKAGSPGCAVGVVRGGATVYAKGFGSANLEYDVPITTRSIFHVASISKQFAAFAVATLASQGKLSLDDAVKKHIPEFPDFGTTVTIRHLLHHTSGLRDQWTLLRHSGWRPDDLITDNDVLTVISRQRELNFSPGAEYSYSNSGYTLIGIIVSRLTGMSLRQWCEANIFKPLGMAETHFHDDHTMAVKNRTSAYEPKGTDSYRVSVPVFDTVGATSLFTTVEDLAKWDENFYTAKIGGRALLDQMQAASTLNDGGPLSYGFGLMLGRYRGLRFVEHGGSDAGYRGHIMRFPEQHFSVVALCNVATAGPSLLARRVADIYLEGQFSQPAPIVAPPAYSASAEELKAAEGMYFNAKSQQATRLTVSKGRLIARSGGGNASAIPTGPGKFRPDGSSVEWTITAAPGRPRQLRDGSGASEEVQAWQPTTAQLNEFAGDYYSAELDYTYRVVVKGVTLTLERRRLDDRVLEPTMRDSFAAANVGDLRFVRDATGAITGCVENTGRIRNLKFVRRATAAGVWH